MTGRLVLTPDTTHLVEGHFNIKRMLEMLQAALQQALNDGHQGLWASGDMSREFGPEREVSQLLEYEGRLEEFLQSHPALSGICQYHADTLPGRILQQGLVTHSSISSMRRCLDSILILVSDPHFPHNLAMRPLSIRDSKHTSQAWISPWGLTWTAT